jgi:spore germination cell wall hydrolase CwlJ-like protein
MKIYKTFAILLICALLISSMKPLIPLNIFTELAVKVENLCSDKMVYAGTVDTIDVSITDEIPTVTLNPIKKLQLTKTIENELVVDSSNSTEVVEEDTTSETSENIIVEEEESETSENIIVEEESEDVIVEEEESEAEDTIVEEESETESESSEDEGTTYGGYTYTSYDVYLLAKIIMAEAEGESQLCKEYVGQTIMNRVYHNDFPNTIYGVIFDGKQFTPTFDGRWERVEPNQACYNAAYKVLNASSPLIDSLYFAMMRSGGWHNRALKLICVEDGTGFYKYK